MNDSINRYLSILCYPFVSLDFFTEDLFEKILSGKNGDAEVQKAAIRYVQRNFSVYSLDEIYLYLEKCYLYDLRNRKYKTAMKLYMDCMNNIMQSMISQRDGKIVFKYWKNDVDASFLGGFGDANKIFLFHSLNMHLPLDFIVMLYMAQNEHNDIFCLNNYYGQIEIADQQLDLVLSAGVSENHLHKGVSVSFLEFWDILMMPAESSSINELKKMPLNFGDGMKSDNEVLFFTLSASIVRILIALEIHDYTLVHETVMEKQNYPWRQENELVILYQNFADGRKLESVFKEQFEKETSSVQVQNILTYYLQMWDTLLQILPHRREGRTLIQEIFQVPNHLHTSDENIFLFYGMKHLLKNTSNQNTAKSFMQYLRIRNYIFSCTVQKKTIRGLDYFQTEYYHKDSTLNSLMGNLKGRSMGESVQVAYWEMAMRKQFQNQYLKKIEFRAAINANEASFRKNIEAFLLAYYNVIRDDYCQNENGRYIVCHTFPKVGLVYHLLKRKDEFVTEKCFIDGESDPSKLQYGILKEVYNQQIQIMLRLRDEISGLDRYIVGLDAASLENSTPVWVFCGAYESARDSRIETIGYNRIGTQSLRFTFHAGEDFRHILSGLRRMDEAITFLKFHAGDRLGHGTALGISPEIWRRYNPFIVIPRMEALENYIWAYYILSQDSISFQSTIMAYIERRIDELARGIYGKSQGISVQNLVEGYLRTFDMALEEHYRQCEYAEDIGFCSAVREKRCEDIIWNGEKIALAKHCKKFLLEMEQPINYEITDQDILITRTIQTILRKKIGQCGIVIEINPSSNMAIGEVDKITDNQIYQLNRPDQNDNVMVCVNSDDPMVFNTNVSNELSYIYYGMLHNAASRESALAWIDKVRKCGLEASFIQTSESDQQIFDHLNNILKHI